MWGNKFKLFFEKPELKHRCKMEDEIIYEDLGYICFYGDTVQWKSLVYMVIISLKSTNSFFAP
jgi:hypothetical protein